MRKEIHHAFSPVHASPQTLEEVLKMMETAPKTTHAKSRKALRTILIAAALITALLTLTAFGVDYVLNHREIFFFDSLEALTERQSSQYPQAAVSYAVPGTAEENKNSETSAEYVSRAMRDGLLGNETLISRSEGDYFKDGWTQQVIRSSKDSYYGDVVTEYRTAAEYAQELHFDGILDWDLSILANDMVPMENGQIAVLCHSRQDGQLLWIKSHLGYIPQEGKRFSLSYEYNTFFDYSEDTEYVLNSAYDRGEIFVTQDHIEVLIQEFDGQIWCSAVNGYKSVNIYTDGCTWEEVEDILNHLDLASVLAE